MWAFETARGEDGIPDPKLGISGASTQRLNEVAPRSGDHIRYTYDFGDGWEHDVVVEATSIEAFAGGRQRPPNPAGPIRAA